MVNFQKVAKKAIVDVLRERGIPQAFMEAEDADGKPWMSCVFQWSGREYEIEIFQDSVVMTSGKELFEPYMPREFSSADAQIIGFTTRLDRYLSGGDWEGPDEEGFVERCLKAFRRRR